MASGQQNRYNFPIICICAQALVDSSNIPRFSLWHWAGYFICSRKISLKKIFFLKQFCFCAPCLTVSAALPVEAMEISFKQLASVFCQKRKRTKERILSQILKRLHFKRETTHPYGGVSKRNERGKMNYP